MIYLITNQQDESCKIGFSNNPTTRLHQLQIGCSSTLQLRAVIDGSKQDEQILHVHFKKFLIRGEWFHCVKEIKDYFEVEDYININKINILKLGKCSGIELKVFLLSLKTLTPHSGKVDLSMSTRKLISNEACIKMSSINNAVSSLQKKEIIFKIQRDFYLNHIYYS